MNSGEMRSASRRKSAAKPPVSRAFASARPLVPAGSGNVRSCPIETAASSLRERPTGRIGPGHLRAHRGGGPRDRRRARRWCASSGSRSTRPTAAGSATRPTTCRRSAIGEVMRGLGLGRGGRVEATRTTRRASSSRGWSAGRSTSSPPTQRPCCAVPVAEGVSPSAYLGALGMTGLTAWVGIREIGKPQGGRDGRRLGRRRRGRLGRRPARQARRRPRRRHRRRPREVRAAHRAARLRRRRRPPRRGLARSSSRPPPPTASTSTSRTSAARSWTRSSPASTSAPASRSAG